MTKQPIEKRASFDIIRYAQGWEDADILTRALVGKAGRRFLSVAAAGDNTLALLTLDPSEVVAADLSKAQLYCLQLRINAMQALEYKDFITLMEPTPTTRRRAIATGLISGLNGDERRFWEERLDDIAKKGLGGIGKFENYFALFRRYILPFIVSKNGFSHLFEMTNQQERLQFYENRWNTWRWKLMTKLFFSKTVMGKLGRDPAFFDYAEGSLSKQVREKVRHAIVEMEPRNNPYMQWILFGYHRHALPLSWRPEHYETIRSRLDRVKLIEGGVETAEGNFDGFNLSDIFEYMSLELSAEIYGKLLSKANPQARFVYWNMMVPRKAAQKYTGRIRASEEEMAKLLKQDNAFFYSALVLEDVVA